MICSCACNFNLVYDLLFDCFAIELQNLEIYDLRTGASFEGAGGWGPCPLPPPRGERRKEKKKEEKEKKKKKKERKKGTMNNVKLLHIKCCFFPIFQ